MFWPAPAANTAASSQWVGLADAPTLNLSHRPHASTAPIALERFSPLSCASRSIAVPTWVE